MEGSLRDQGAPWVNKAFAYTTEDLTTATSIVGFDSRPLIHTLQMTLGDVSELSVEDRRVGLFALGDCGAANRLMGAVAFSRTGTRETE